MRRDLPPSLGKRVRRSCAEAYSSTVTCIWRKLSKLDRLACADTIHAGTDCIYIGSGLFALSAYLHLSYPESLNQVGMLPILVWIHA